MCFWWTVCLLKILCPSTCPLKEFKFIHHPYPSWRVGAGKEGYEISTNRHSIQPALALEWQSQLLPELEAYEGQAGCCMLSGSSNLMCAKITGNVGARLLVGLVEMYVLVMLHQAFCCGMPGL